MKQIFFLFFTTLSLHTAAQINRCQILGMEHFGGNGEEGLVRPYVVTHPDGNFSLCVATNSDSGNVFLSCNNGTVSGGSFYRTYNANYTALVNEYCAPIGSNFLWQTFYAYPQANGDTILIGTREDPLTSFDALIERRNGSIIWNKKYGGSGADAPDVIVPSNDSGFFVLTGTNSTDGDVGMHYGSAFASDIWLLRLDNNGDKLWSKVIGGTEFDLVRTVIPSDDGGCYLFGATVSSDYDATGLKGSSDLWIVKLDSAGNKQWHKCLGGSGADGSGYDNGTFAIKDRHGGFYVLNRTASHDGDIQRRKPSTDGKADFWLLHIDSMANIIWENTFGADNEQIPVGLCQAADGTLWMAGSLSGGLPPIGGDTPDYYKADDIWVVHADTSGNMINQRTLGGSRSWDSPEMIYPLSDGTVLVAGSYYIDFGFPMVPHSPGFPQTTEGIGRDIFIAHLGPNTVGIDAPDASSFSWTLYPNPAKNEIEISLSPQTDKDLMLLLTDANGKQLLKQPVTDNQIKITTKQFVNGLYYISLRNREGYIQTKKIIIQH